MINLEERYQHLEQTILAYNPAADVAKVRSAYEFAAEAHKDQKRKDGSPYVTHPLAVAQIVAEELHLDTDSIIAALLHDTIEDTPVTHEEVAKLFSPTVADLVEGVSKLTRVHSTSKVEQQMENLRKMLMAMSKDIRVILVKIADRMHNMRTMEYQTPEKQKQKSFETMEIYAPIAHRLGIQRMKWELEDLSLKYLDPVSFEEINTALAAKKIQYKDFMDHIIHQIRQRSEEAGIKDATIYGRLKHPYSIYRKMYAQNKTFNDIFDLIAFRVIVDTQGDCYNVLGIIHDLYYPILGRFKDYIGNPKPNGYQSLHTTVMSTGDAAGIRFEVQIRTREMHEIAEYGIAAHWKYKQHGQGAGDEKDYEWVRRLLENQESTEAEEFIHSLKVDMFADEVFVFTPNGDVVNLPAGATPIDFAYTIHSAVGNRMTGAKVNGHIVQYDYTLKNGDVVEVITSKNARGPGRDWLKIAKSSEARSKIRQWFKKECRDENIVTGRASFEAEIKRLGVSLKELTASPALPDILKKFSYNTLDDLYASIGYGGITTLKAVGRFREEIQRIIRQRQLLRSEQPDPGKLPVDKPILKPQKPLPQKAVQGVIVKGMSNCLVKFAKCCAPVPGDDIVGFITRGYGVSVHRKDCPNASPARQAEEPGRWIEVDWAVAPEETFSASLHITARNRNRLLMDILSVLSAEDIRGKNLTIAETPDDFAVLDMDVQVNGSSQLQALVRKLQQVEGVMRVTRPTG